jgi:hypothetical protein
MNAPNLTEEQAGWPYIGILPHSAGQWGQTVTIEWTREERIQNLHVAQMIFLLRQIANDLARGLPK